MAFVIAPFVQTYATRGHLRRLLDKSRLAVTCENYRDFFVTVSIQDPTIPDSGVTTLELLPNLTMLMPTKPVDLILVNGSNEFPLTGVDRLFICPARIEAVQVLNKNDTPVEIRVITA